MKCGKLLAFNGNNRTSSRLAKKRLFSMMQACGKIVTDSETVHNHNMALLASPSKYGYF